LIFKKKLETQLGAWFKRTGYKESKNITADKKDVLMLWFKTQME